MRGARTGGGTPDGIRPRLDAGLEQGAKHSFFSSRPHFQSGVIQTGVRSEISSFVAGLTENPSAAATLVTLLDPPAVPSRPVCGLSRRLLVPPPAVGLHAVSY